MEWRDVVGYEGIYEVSDTGEVRTKEGKTTYTERHGIRRWKQRVLKQKVSKDKTCRVHLWKNGQSRTWLVHRLVAMAFLPMEEGRDYINHKDGSRLNNHVANLEWCNHEENQNHAFDTGLTTSNKRVLLMDMDTRQTHYFRSLAKASEFLGRNKGYVSGKLQKGESEIDGHIVFVEGGKN